MTALIAVATETLFTDRARFAQVLALNADVGFRVTLLIGGARRYVDSAVAAGFSDFWRRLAGPSRGLDPELGFDMAVLTLRARRRRRKDAGTARGRVRPTAAHGFAGFL